MLFLKKIYQLIQDIVNLIILNLDLNEDIFNLIILNLEINKVIHF